MTNIGDKFSVGSICPQTGEYKHSACGKIETYNRGNVFAPCAKSDCPNKGFSWILIKILP